MPYEMDRVAEALRKDKCPECGIALVPWRADDEDSPLVLCPECRRIWDTYVSAHVATEVQPCK